MTGPGGRDFFGAAGRAEARREPRWTELVESLTEPLQLLLIAVGVIYAVLGELEDALTILAVILTVAIVETLSEARAKGAIAAVRTLSAPTASVLREGTPVEIAAAEVVPGDGVGVGQWPCKRRPLALSWKRELKTRHCSGEEAGVP